MITSEDGKIRVLDGSDIIQKYKGNGQAIATGDDQILQTGVALFNNYGLIDIHNNARLY